MLEDKFKIQIQRNFLINNEQIMLNQVLKQQKKEREKGRREFEAKCKLFDEELVALQKKYHLKLRGANVVNDHGEVVTVVLNENVPEEKKESNIVK
jgi:hypothetical protein